MPKVTAIVSRTARTPSLVQGRDYEVISIDDAHFRIVDESKEPALYPKSFFLDCEIHPPDGWEHRRFEDGEYELSPPEFAARGFFEDYADGQDEACRIYRMYLENNNL
jgi:hypothetical protein